MPKVEQIPKCPDAPSDCSTGLTVCTYQVRIVTPMLGGGVEGGTIDPQRPIRETAIRGHLRHWWRLTSGCGKSDRNSMWRREEEIFGSTAFPSPLTVRVLNSTELQMFEPWDREIVSQFGSVA